MTPTLALLALLAGTAVPARSVAPSLSLNEVTAVARQLTAPDAAVREQAAQKLLHLGTPAIEPLIELAKKADPPLLDAIRSLLPRFGLEAIDSLYQAYAKTSVQREFARLEVQKAIAAMGAPVIPEMRRILNENVPYGQSRKPFALGVLREMGPAGTDELVSLLSHGNIEIRSNAAGILAITADPRSADAMLAALESPDASVRFNAARGLNNLQERRAIGPLLKHLNDPEPGPRAAAAVALANMYERRLLGPIVSVARADSRIGNRESVANALIRRKEDPAAVRLGRRYRPLNISPAAEELLQLRWGLFLTGTGLLLWLAIWLAAWRSETTFSIGSFTVSKWTALLACVVLGLYWGYWVRGVSATLEYLLLFIAVPVAGFMAVVAGSQLKPLIKPALGALVALGLALVAPTLGMLFYLLLIKLAPWVLGLVVVVGVAAAAWQFWKQPDPARTRQHFRPALVALSTFYVAYGVGWLALWGYLGF